MAVWRPQDRPPGEPNTVKYRSYWSNTCHTGQIPATVVNMGCTAPIHHPPSRPNTGQISVVVVKIHARSSGVRLDKQTTRVLYWPNTRFHAGQMQAFMLVKCKVSCWSNARFRSGQMPGFIPVKYYSDTSFIPVKYWSDCRFQTGQIPATPEHAFAGPAGCLV